MGIDVRRYYIQKLQIHVLCLSVSRSNCRMTVCVKSVSLFVIHVFSWLLKTALNKSMVNNFSVPAEN
jgi:hypothetical protein